ncbi:hypothetical protein [Pseudogemmobacter bohemicus]|uniref:hypothetical protein n=1 Tax=Pseudogemmobacter bohemicus TaxID=2250708 RepID=UPI0013002BC4|nr:hypothetical protein [Pseudogemmobacter bohemicus]
MEFVIGEIADFLWRRIRRPRLLRYALAALFIGLGLVIGVANLAPMVMGMLSL